MQRLHWCSMQLWSHSTKGCSSSTQPPAVQGTWGPVITITDGLSSASFLSLGPWNPGGPCGWMFISGLSRERTGPLNPRDSGFCSLRSNTKAQSDLPFSQGLCLLLSWEIPAATWMAEFTLILRASWRQMLVERTGSLASGTVDLPYSHNSA